MPIVTLADEVDFDGWRDAARALALAGTAARDVTWQVGGGPARTPEPAAGTGAAGFSVPRSFIDLARAVVCHADPDRFSRLYAALLRLRSMPPGSDPDPGYRQLEEMAREVQQALHQMRIAAAFAPVGDAGNERLIAWFEPRHHILGANAAFFARHVPSRHWSVLTPSASLHRDGDRLAPGPGAERGDGPIDRLWAAYLASAGAPENLALLGSLAADAWKDPPAGALSSPGSASGGADLAKGGSPGRRRTALEAVREEAMACRRCPLWKPATQTVFGEGPVDALMMLVGEQPGDQEDLAGRPFVGPAGQLLDRALTAAGIDRSATYVTNAVKHFKFEPRGKRRIHSKPQAAEIEACHWWIDQERMIVKPRITVALGATAARALLGRVVTIGRTRGEAITLADGGECWVTIHPSYLLRIDDRDRAEQEFDAFVADLKRAASRAASSQIA